MPWTRIDDGWSSHRKVARAGPEACGFWLALCCYSARHLTDGLVPERDLGMVFPGVSKRRAETLVRRLIDAGMVEVLPKFGPNFPQTLPKLSEFSDRVLKLHDFLDYNPSAEKIKRERELARQRQKKRRSMSRRDSRVTNASPTRPDPSPSISTSLKANSLLGMGEVHPGYGDEAERIFWEDD